MKCQNLFSGENISSARNFTQSAKRKKPLVSTRYSLTSGQDVTPVLAFYCY